MKRKPLWQRYRIVDQTNLDDLDDIERETDYAEEVRLESHRRACYLLRKLDEERAETEALKPKPPEPKPAPPTPPTPHPQPSLLRRFKTRARITSPAMALHWTNVTTDILQQHQYELVTGFCVFRLKQGGWYGDRDGHWFQLHPELLDDE